MNLVKTVPLRVAIYKSATTRNEEIKTYLDSLGIPYSFVECNSTDEQMSKLQSGEADVLSGITLSYFPGTRNVATFAPRPYYFVTTKGSTELTAELDAAIDALNYTRPTIQEQLQSRYFGDMSTGYVLSDEEFAYMTSLEQIRVLCKNNDLPYVAKDSDGNARGMIVSLLNDFAALNRISVTYTLCDTLEEFEREWATGNYDCMIGVPFSSAYCSANNMIRTEAITSVDIVLFAKQQTTKAMSESTVAIYSRLADHVNLTRYGNVLMYDNPADCYKAVESGKADYGCTDRFLSEYTISDNNYSYTVIPLVGEQQDICIAVARRMGNEFLSALNKFIHTLSDSTKTTYISDGNHHGSVNWITLFFRTKPILASLVVAAVIVLLLAAVLFAFYAEKNKKKNLVLEKNKVALSDALIHAEEASNAKGNFMSRMSHEIRTPLNAIIGYLEIAKDEEGNSEKTSYCLDKSQLASRHLLSIINDVLDVSSIESGRMKIAHEDFDLKQLINELTTIFYAQAKAKGVKFDVSVDRIEHEWFSGDELRVKQILLNLLSNAVKFTPEGGNVTLGIRQAGIKDEKTLLEFTVRDTGIGMSEEYKTRMFNPFEQESASTAKTYGGTGLGLSISSNLVRMMNGQIKVESEQGKGTVFTVVLPFDSSVKQPADAGSTPANFFENVNALVVDDEADTCEYVKKLMIRFGVRCDTVTSGKKALRRITSRMEDGHPYDLCIIDWCMKEMNGLDTAREIRKLCGSELPIIIATAYDYTEIVDEAKKVGVDRIISKPLFQSTLFNLLMNTYGKYIADEPKAAFAVDLRGNRLILAEDNEMNMEIALDILGKAGLEITPVVNGKEALDTFLASKPDEYDGILMDIQMPVMDGYEAANKIRASAHPCAKTIPIIAMTANAFNEDVAAAIAAGMNDHISKPINYDKLFAALGRFINKGKPQGGDEQ